MIKNKHKKCKGTGIAKGYGCGTLTLYRTYGLGKMCCYADWLLNSENGKIKTAKSIIKVSEPRIELEKIKDDKKREVKLSNLIDSVKQTCHKYIRLRDKYKECISCGSPWHDKFQAGHFYKAELFSTIKFNEYNINGQCVKCNIRKEGNESEYRVNLPKRIGKDNFKELNYLASLDKKTKHKWCREELTKTRNYYKVKLNQLNQKKT